MVTVKTVSTTEEDAAISVIVAAFRADPVAQWFYTDPQAYAEVFPSFVKAFAGAAFTHNSAYCTDDGAGTALWLPPGVHADEETLLAILEDTIDEQRLPGILALMRQMDSYHPREPHWYLPMIGVMPVKQVQGHGTALLMHALERCDVEQKVAYLEASSGKSVPLYQRHGFEVIGTIQVGSSPPLFPMVRKPRTLRGTKKHERIQVSGDGWLPGHISEPSEGGL